jgi:hypothetical protein
LREFAWGIGRRARVERLFLADERRDEQRGDLNKSSKTPRSREKENHLIAPTFSDGETCTEKKEDIL